MVNTYDVLIPISRNVECGTLHCTGGNAKPRYTAQNTYSTHNRKFDNREVQVHGAEHVFWCLSAISGSRFIIIIIKIWRYADRPLLSEIETSFMLW